VAVPVLWSAAEEFPGERWGRKYRNIQVRCWWTVVVVRNAQVPGPEPSLRQRRGRSLWAGELQGEGDLPWLCQHGRLCRA